MRYTRPYITKLNQEPHRQFSLHSCEMELDLIVMDKMRSSLSQMDHRSIQMLKELFESRSGVKEILLKRLK